MLTLSASAVLFFAIGCSPPAPPPEAGYRPTATVRDIMDAVVDPSADYLWDSVEVIVTAQGREERAPKTDEEWNEVRRRAIALAEASNLLLVPGRRIAGPGAKAEDPAIELGPDQIEAMLSQDRTSWTLLAHGLHDAAMEALKAIEAKDKDALLYSGESLDKACETCHLKYWYPPGPPKKQP
ncbi:MAG: hypothetical protein A3H97_24330 [Acidobacteria bacterium RIFCSPLOWO2_02_FULL_65_29]|nr:MAG: hypothetical protein A3H97_24330 [Acidobacteria bacterium RIFCSPLOWO2_02_FULL_65_29]